MKRPNPKDYYSKDFINGKYENDLETYIDYLVKIVKQECKQFNEKSNI